MTPQAFLLANLWNLFSCGFSDNGAAAVLTSWWLSFVKLRVEFRDCGDSASEAASNSGSRAASPNPPAPGIARVVATGGSATTRAAGAAGIAGTAGTAVTEATAAAEGVEASAAAAPSGGTPWLSRIFRL